MDEKITGKLRSGDEASDTPPRSYLPPRPIPDRSEIKQQFANRAAMRGENTPRASNREDRFNLPNRPAARPTARPNAPNRPGKEQVKGKDPIMTTLFLQVVLAVITLLLCLLLRATDAQLYHTTKDKYWDNMKGNTNSESLNPVHWFEEGQLETLRQTIEEAVMVFSGQPELLFVDPQPQDPALPAPPQDTPQASEQEEAPDQTADPLSSEENLNGQGGWFGVAAADAETYKVPTGVSLLRVPLSAPAVYPAYGRLTSPFGYRTHPTTGQLDFHRGIDIAAATGSDIYSVYPGTVTETGFSAIYGNYIKVQHSATVSTVYSHCSDLLAQVGTVVRQGERIATVGSTGISTGPHLDFQLLVQEVYVNPLLAFDMV